MPSLRSILLPLLAASAITSAERLRVVFSSGSFSTISGPGGDSESNFHEGFAILNEKDEAIYNDGTPDQHSPCKNVDDGREFTIEGDCWDSPRTFKCKSEFDGSPDKCEVKDGDGKSLGTGEGKSHTTFIGIAIALDASCVVEFDSDGDGCPVDEGDGPLHVTSG